MLRLSSVFESHEDVAEALYQMALWSGGRTSSVWIPQFSALKRLVREISRTPSGSRIRNLFREINLWPEEAEVSSSLAPRGASDLFLAAQMEASALLELGYPRDDGIDFITRIPCPGVGTPRTRSEIRAAIHHVGGDSDLMMALFRSPDRFHPALRVCFSVWPHRLYHVPGMSADETFSLHLHYPGQVVPAVLTMNRALLGYCLLVAFDLVTVVLQAAGSGRGTEDFESFAEAFLKSTDSQ